MNRFYYIFEKEKILHYVKDLWEEKPDVGWIGYVMGFFSTVLVIYNTLNTKPSFETFDAVIITLLVISMLFLITMIFKSFIKWIKYKNKHLNLADELENVSIENDYTNLFLVKVFDGEDVKILVKKDISAGYWLPFITDDQQQMDENTLIKNLEDVFPFKLDIVEHQGAKLKGILKAKPNRGYSNINYKFYHLQFYIDYVTFKKDFLDKHKNYQFVTIEDMKKDNLTIKTNFDIVSHLEQLAIPSLENSFDKVEISSKLKNLKVIWNITKSCSYNCSFCATNSGNGAKDTLTFEDHVKIAEELNKIRGLHLDIAGGDPFNDENVIKTLEHISKYMIQDLTITTTGFAIKKYAGMDISKIYKIAKEYDISYDYPAQWEASHRGSQYNKLNHEYIKHLIKNGINVNILITLSQHNTKNQDVINKMIDEIKDLDPTSVTLLRLMPVGRQDYANYPKQKSDYDPMSAIDAFKSVPELKEKLKLHCAFRAHLSEQTCNMLTEKIGVDAEGNVFGCAWTGYLNVRREENPFYLGNLLENTLEEIFDSESYTKLYNILNGKKKNHCPVFSYLEDSKEYMDGEKDEFKKWIAQ